VKIFRKPKSETKLSGSLQKRIKQLFDKFRMMLLFRFFSRLLLLTSTKTKDIDINCKKIKKQNSNRSSAETTDDEKIQIQKEDFILLNFSYLTREI